MKIVSALLTLVFLLAPSRASQGLQERARASTRAKPQPPVGIVSGRVFAITKGGDLKPARMAFVYLFHHEPYPPSKREMSIVARYYLNLRADTLGLTKDEEEKGCWRSLSDVLEALQKTYSWAVEAKQTAAAHFTETDEEGKFQFSNVLPGVHTIVVYGQAGANMAHWEQEVVVGKGKSIMLKVSSVKHHCSNLN